MSYLTLTFFALLALLAAFALLALSRWWSPPAQEREPPRPHRRLPLHAHRVLFYVLIGEAVLIFLSAWAVQFRDGWAQGRSHLGEMGIFALVALVGLFYLWRKEGRG